MAVADEFINHCSKTLEVNFGQLSGELINRVKAKKNLADSPNISDFKEFIDIIELNISVLCGKNKASDICNSLRTRAVEMTAVQKKEPESGINSDIEKEINIFLTKNSLPTEGDITDYAKYLAIKYGGNAKKVQKNIIEKVKNHVKIVVARKKVNEEIGNFLTRYPQPGQRDVDDFINYLHLLKLNFQEDETREMIEKERLHRKFHGEQSAVEETPQLDQFIDIVKTKDKKDLQKAMQKQEISYLIKDESGVSNEMLSDFVELTKPNENDMRDTLEGLGLKHMIKKK